MGYFNYHAKIKNKIKNGELEKFEITDEYNGIKPALVLYFDDGKVFPIREHRFDEYLKLLLWYYKYNKNSCKTFLQII